jgi:hypothetical protein
MRSGCSLLLSIQADWSSTHQDTPRWSENVVLNNMRTWLAAPEMAPCAVPRAELAAFWTVPAAAHSADTTATATSQSKAASRAIRCGVRQPEAGIGVDVQESPASWHNMTYNFMNLSTRRARLTSSKTRTLCKRPSI